jgi:mannose-6-phosphate isomerase-like protein (cupin superfamily)
MGEAMEIRNREKQEPFTTKDGSTIISLLDSANAPVKNQSLAEAQIPAGGSTQRHYHMETEEFYYLLRGRGRMEIDGESQTLAPGDAVLIPAGAWHQITAYEDLAFLCCCAPPYRHEDTYFH